MPNDPNPTHPVGQFSKLHPDRFLAILATFEGALDKVSPAKAALIVEEREWELVVAYEAHEAATASGPALPLKIAGEQIMGYLPIGLRTEAVMRLVLQDLQRMEACDGPIAGSAPAPDASGAGNG